MIETERRADGIALIDDRIRKESRESHGRSYLSATEVGFVERRGRLELGSAELSELS